MDFNMQEVNPDQPLPEMRFNSIDKMEIFQVVQQHMSFREVMKCRLVCKRFNEFVSGLNRIREAAVFQINGNIFRCNSDESSPDCFFPPIRTLLNSQFNWVHLIFRNIYIGRLLFEIEDLFTRFKTNCQCVKSLIFDTAYCQMGHVIEVIASCPDLTEVQILNSPSMFKAGPEILKSGNYMAAFVKNVAHLKNLTIYDGRYDMSVMSLGTIQGWTSKTTNLVTLDLRVPIGGAGQIPMSYMSQILRQNQSTLLYLTLVGSSRIDPLMTTAFQTLTLTSLTLGGVEFSPYPRVLNQILSTQIQLKFLHLLEMKIHKSVFSLMGKQHRQLEVLRLENLTYTAPPPFECLSNIKTIRNLAILGKCETVDESLWWRPLFGTGPGFCLESLTLRLQNAYNLLRGLVMKTLKSLIILGCGEIEGDADSIDILIRKVFRMSQLENLTIHDTTLCDKNFPPSVIPADLELPTVTRGPTFINLTCLSYLNLANTRISDSTFTGHVIYIPKLTWLDISGTLVSWWGLWNAAERRLNGNQKVLPSIETILAQNCQYARMTVKLHKYIEDALGMLLVTELILEETHQDQTNNVEDADGEVNVEQVHDEYAVHEPGDMENDECCDFVKKDEGMEI